MKKGDILKFYKFNWVVTKVKTTPTGYKYGMYRPYRKFFRRILPLSNTNYEYSISEARWNFLKEKLTENPRYHYNMSNWANNQLTH